MDSIPCCVSEVYLHLLYNVSVFVCTVSVSARCVFVGCMCAHTVSAVCMSVQSVFNTPKSCAFLK